MNLEELYKSFRTDQDCRDLLLQSHWFASFADFDPKTGQTLPMSLNKALERMSTRKPSIFVKDRLWLLAAHSEEAVRRLMRALSEEPRRESAYLPIRQVRELDTASFIALSRRPGRNIREKLADKPYMQAVRHFQSIDVPENRLLKTYLMALADALELRRKYLKDRSVDDLLQTIYRWLNEDEIKEIARWDNLTPNNTLLSHRDYRRVWNSWRWLQVIEDDIDRDMAHFAERKEVREKWEGLAKRYADGTTVFADEPIMVDFNTFSIIPWCGHVKAGKVSKVNHRRQFFETREPVCLDLTQIQPVYATPSGSGRLEDSFFWQRWENDEETVDIELFDSDAVFLHPDATTITYSDMFFFKGENQSILNKLNQASRSFSLRLREHFHNDRLIWLTPDNLNDFELELVRRNINADFAQAEPLPCSVAAVFEHIEYSKIEHDGYCVAVVERINGKAYLTEMVAHFDGNLAKALPETRGFIWERGASELFSNDVETDSVEASVYLYNGEGWTREYNPYGVAHKTDQDVVMPLEGYDCAIWLNGRPVSGGIKLYQLQSQIRDIPLWRNHIPELMTKVMMNGFYQPFYFVGQDVTVQPIRGRAVKINVPEEFTLPKGKKTYRLPLLQGANEEAIEYEAKLVSKDFPYAEDVKCRLNMTYTYGADDPYKLVFEPLDRNYRPISVVWQLKEDVVIDDAPAPGYPVSLTWRELQHHWNPKRNEESDFLEWSQGSTSHLIEMLDRLSSKPVEARMKMNWKRNVKGAMFAFAQTADGEDYYINEHSLLRDVDSSDIYEGVKVFFYVTRQGDRTKAWHVAPASGVGEYQFLFGKEVKRFIRSSLYVPYINVWADGRTLAEAECPDEYRRTMSGYIKKLNSYSANSRLAEPIQVELVFLLCCTGRDMPAAMGSRIVEQAKERDLRAKALGYALGDLSAPWQRDALEIVLANCDNWAVQALAAAAWRNKDFIDCLTYDQVAVISSSLSHILAQECDRIISQGRLSNEKAEIGRVVKYLELLLGLLRTRESSDETLRMYFQPGQDITISFEESVNRLVENALKYGYSYASRLKLDVSTRSDDDRTPDFLYALRVYLSGDNAASAIRVTGIVDDIDD